MQGEKWVRSEMERKILSDVLRATCNGNTELWLLLKEAPFRKAIPKGVEKEMVRAMRAFDKLETAIRKAGKPYGFAQ